ncbi:putative EMP1-like protein, partial [Plasmodium gaboni]
MPTQTSTNRYVPYRSAQYKGKTYIYMEGDEPDDYLRYISSSDITSSSESEYEEMDINDIYPYKSPKYKTLIEVVLKPSTSGTTNNAEKPFSDDTPNDDIHSDKPSHIPSDIPSDNISSDKHSHIPSDIQSGDIPTNTPISEEEWNELKKDFISQYLQNIQKDLPNENKSGNTFMDSQPNILPNNMEEK